MLNNVHKGTECTNEIKSRRYAPSHSLAAREVIQYVAAVGTMLHIFKSMRVTNTQYLNSDGFKCPINQNTSAWCLAMY